MDNLKPSQLVFQSVFTRRCIIASYWLVVLLALPLWWTTTSIDRLSLPASRVVAQQSRELVFPVDVQLDLSAFDKNVNSTALEQGVQQLLRELDVQQSGGLCIHINPEKHSDGAYQVVLRHGNEDPTVEGRRLLYEIPETMSSLAAMQLADTLATLLVPYTTLRSPRHEAEHIVKYSPRYRVAFTLLNQDAATGIGALGWDVRASISRHIAPTLEKLSLLHNFTVESQIQFHAPLAFRPRSVLVDDKEEFALTQEDLTVFINSAEWTLSSSVSNDPVLHLILFIPSATSTPLHILSRDGSISASNAFILPQWGGIVIMNLPSLNLGPSHLPASTLDSVFAVFRYQLTTLLGVPPLPAHIHCNDSETFSDWQLDALLRRRAVENEKGSKETLKSIISLVAQIENMPVGQDVKGDVQGAISALDEMYSAAAASSSALALSYSSKAFTLASRAFFNPGMLALLYFPAEHKYAVYTPLFASVAAPLVAALVREFVAWKRSRKASADESRSSRAVNDSEGADMKRVE
ncbi:phosphatidylinositol-glycan biosynthesis class S protein-domain-containing protein [Sparassis latifolia]